MNYYDRFDPFGFTDTEADAIHSDAQQCDFGQGVATELHAPKLTTGFSAMLSADITRGSDLEVRNNTQEVTSSDFGTHFTDAPGNPGPGSQEIWIGSAGLPLSRSSGRGHLETWQVGTPTGGGAHGPKQTAIEAGSPDVLGTYAAVLNKPGHSGASIGSTAPQHETAKARAFVGQLTTDRAAGATGKK